MPFHPTRRASRSRHHSTPPGLCEPLERRVLLSAELVRNIGITTPPSDPDGVVNVDGTLYFAADDGVSGRELWKSDGTAAGTVRVKDIAPGTDAPFGYPRPNSSSPAELTNVGGTLYFTAEVGASGRELWKSDGTAAGTVRVKDIFPGTHAAYDFVEPNSSGPADLTDVNGTLYFTADDGVTGRNLWKSDGTAAGTVRVKDIFPGRPSYNSRQQGSLAPASLTDGNGTLFFIANDGASGRELWRSDGTTAGTRRVKDIFPGAGTDAYGYDGPNSSSPAGLTYVNGTLYFTADDGQSGRELWRSDGTAGGTRRVKDLSAAAGDSDPGELTRVGGVLYFAATGAGGRELWRTDGTAAGTVRIKDVNAGPADSSPGGLTEVGGELYFAADDGRSGRELWKSDGTAAGTVRVKDVFPGTYDGPGDVVPYSSSPGDLTNVNGTLYFAAGDSAAGRELWKSDGTAAGTARVKDVFTGTGYRYGDVVPNSSLPAGLTPVNGTLFFTAGDAHGRELWRTDGMAAGTRRVKDISAVESSGYPSGMTEFNGTVYFAADDGLTGSELWRTDGTAAGTARAVDIAPGHDFDDGGSDRGPARSSPADLTIVNGTLFFSTDGYNGGYGLWRSDGTPAGTVLLRDFTYGDGGGHVYYDGLGRLATVDGTLFFNAYDGEAGDELWTSDGTAAGTRRVKDIFPGTDTDYYGNPVPASASPGGLTGLNGRLLFAATDAAGGRELWRTDGTAAGTRRVLDIAAGAGGSDPDGFTRVGNVVYFAATTAGRGRELWRTDGTAAGTFRLKDIAAGAAGSFPADLTAVDGTLFFTAYDGAAGRELWKTDGTAAGTVRVKDIERGRRGSSTASLTNVNGTLFFAADDGASGYELWRSDGTAAGTVRVKNIRAGALGSGPQYLTNVNGTLFFSADDGVGGRELWRSDGTAAGTVRERDIVPGRAGSDPEDLAAAGGRLFFSAETPGKGRELWRATPPRPAAAAAPWSGAAGPPAATAFRTAGAPIGMGADDNGTEADDERDGLLSGVLSRRA